MPSLREDYNCCSFVVVVVLHRRKKGKGNMIEVYKTINNIENTNIFSHNIRTLESFRNHNFLT